MNNNKEKIQINLGLDMGIASVGWAITDSNKKELLDAGVRLFHEAGAGTVSDKASDRRLYRGRRRSTRRKDLRKNTFINFLINNGYIKEYNDFYKIVEENKLSILELREKALKEEVSRNQLILIMYNLIKHRGTFNLEDDLLEMDDEFDLNSIKGNDLKLPVEVQKDLKDKYGKYRGIDIKVDKNSLIAHKSYLKEISSILDKQIELNVINKELKDKYLEIFNSKREYFIGPGLANKKTGEESKYGWKDEEEFFTRLAGFDTYDKNEIRAPKHAFTSYLFNILNDLNNIKIIVDENIHREPYITEQEKLSIIKLLLETEKTKIFGLKQLAKLLGVKESAISGYRISSKDNKFEITKFESINKIRNKLTKANLDIKWIKYENKNELDAILKVLTYYQSYESIVNELNKLEFDFLTEDICKKMAEIKLNGTHSLSFKTMNSVIPDMLKENKNSMVLFSENGNINIDNKFNKLMVGVNKLPILRKEINDLYISPVVKRSMIEALKIVREFENNSDYEIKNIVIEMAREKNSSDQKEKIRNTQKLNLEMKESVDQIKKEFIFNKVEIKDTAKANLKLSLYNEQNGRSIYSGNQIDLNRLVKDDNYCEIDHIIPYSLSLDDSKTNKVLVLREENQVKGQKTPLEYFRSSLDAVKLNDFRERVTNTYSEHKHKRYARKKMDNLLSEINSKDLYTQITFLSKNLNDTRYATKEVRDYLKEYNKNSNKNWNIKTVNGGFTAFLRTKYFKFDRKDREQNYHHALDAAVLAFLPDIKLTKDKNILNVIKDEEELELLKENKEFIDLPKEEPLAANNFELFNKSDEIQSFIFNKTKFTRKVNIKSNKQLFDETIYSARKIDGELYKVRKVNIFGDDIKLIDKLFKDNQDNLLIKNSDPETFEYLLKIYNSYKDFTEEIDGKEVKFPNPFIYFRDIQKENIVKQSNEKNPPLIKNLKFIDNKISAYLDISHKYKNMNTTKKAVVLTGLNWISMDVYYSKTLDKYRILKLNPKNFIFGKNEIIKEQYDFDMKRLKIDETYELKFNLNHNDEMEFSYNGVVEKDIYLAGSPNDEIIEFKYLRNNKDKKRYKYSISKISNWKKVTSNVTKSKINKIK